MPATGEGGSDLFGVINFADVTRLGRTALWATALMAAACTLEDVEVRTATWGVVEEVPIEVGDEVESGQLLAVVGRSELHKRVKASRETTQRAQFDLREAGMKLKEFELVPHADGPGATAFKRARLHYEEASQIARSRIQFLEGLEAELRAASVRAPAAGRVSSIHLFRGEVASVGALVARIGPPDGD